MTNESELPCLSIDKWDLITLCRQVQLDPATRLVLLELAFHSSNGESWPSVSRLARIVGVARRSVYRSLATLEDIGAIERDPRFDGRGRSKTTLYRMRLGGLISLAEETGWTEGTSFAIEGLEVVKRRAKDLQIADNPTRSKGGRVTPMSPYPRGGEGDVHVTLEGDAHVTLEGDAHVTPTKAELCSSEECRKEDFADDVFSACSGASLDNDQNTGSTEETLSVDPDASRINQERDGAIPEGVEPSNPSKSILEPTRGVKTDTVILGASSARIRFNPVKRELVGVTPEDVLQWRANYPEADVDRCLGDWIEWAATRWAEGRFKLSFVERSIRRWIERTNTDGVEAKARKGVTPTYRGTNGGGAHSGGRASQGRPGNPARVRQRNWGEMLDSSTIETISEDSNSMEPDNGGDSGTATDCPF